MVSEYEARKLESEIKRKADAHTLDREIVMLANERQKLMRDYHNEPAWRIGTVIKCAVCLFILTSLAVIGSKVGIQPDVPAATQAAGVSGHHAERPAVVEARKALDERRARLDGNSVMPQAQAAR